MASRAVRNWYEALRSLEQRAKAHEGYSRRETARALARAPYHVKLDGQRLSSWLPDDVDQAQIPRFTDPKTEETVWALIRLWNEWAEDPDPKRTYWMDLLEAAQPARLQALAPGGRPAQLPMVPADFVGRVRELDEVRALCAAPGPVVVFGVAGVGKSAVVSYMARELASDYSDGQLFIRLREDEGPRESGSVLAHFLRALDVSAADVPDGIASRAALYRTLLAGRRMLIVLDDAVSEAQVRPLLPGAVGCLVLVSSRNPLPALEGAKPYRLDLLDMDEAVGLLARIAGEDRVASEKVSREVAKLCGRLPLAIRIAAARLRTRTDWTLTHLAGQLTDARRRLRELHTGDLDVRAAFEISYRSLDEDAARLFRLLAVRPGPTFSTEFAAALLGHPVPEIEDLLDVEELLDRLILDQLIETLGTPGRYWMHDLIWLFALDLLVESGEVQLPGHAMLPWYLYKITQVTQGLRLPINAPSSWGAIPAVSTAEALAWLEREEENLFGLLELVDGGNDDELTAFIAAPIMAIAQRYSRSIDTDRVLSIGLAAARRSGNRVTRAALLLLHGEQLIRRREWDRVRECIIEALELVDSVREPSLAGSLHLQLAYAYRGLHRYADAGREMTAAAEVAAAGDPEEAKLFAATLQAGHMLGRDRHQEVIALLEPLLPVMQHNQVGQEVSRARRPAGLGPERARAGCRVGHGRPDSVQFGPPFIARRCEPSITALDPVQLTSGVQLGQQVLVPPLPDPGLVPVPQPPPAGHTRPETQLPQQELPRNRGVENEQDATQRLAIIQPRTTRTITTSRHHDRQQRLVSAPTTRPTRSTAAADPSSRP